MPYKTRNLFRLDGQIAVVTGGCGRLGPWWIKALVEAGASVVCADITGSKMPEMLNHPQVHFVPIDVTDLESLSNAHKKINKQLGKVTILVNNAGIDVRPIKLSKKPDRSEQLPRFRKMWDVNVQGIVNCIEEFVPDMQKAKTGSIINIGSLYADVAPNEVLYDHLGFDKPWSYGATKAAVLQVTRHYGTRFAKYNVRVNAISPGGVLGEQDPEFIRKYSERVPMGRMAEKEHDLGGPLVFLASDASRYITGINLQVNGGYTAW